MPAVHGMAGNNGIELHHRVQGDGNSDLVQGDTREAMVGKEMEKAKEDKKAFRKAKVKIHPKDIWAKRAWRHYRLRRFLPT